MPISAITAWTQETIYTCYVMDAKRAGWRAWSRSRSLLMNAYEARSSATIMDTHVIKATTTDDQEEVADMLQQIRPFIVSRWWTSEDRLVGIVTVDDVVDVMEQEATEDFEKMAAMLPSEKPYLKTGVFQLAKNRIPWLLILMLSSTITGAILVKIRDCLCGGAAVSKLYSDVNGYGRKRGQPEQHHGDPRHGPGRDRAVRTY